jgi:integrase
MSWRNSSRRASRSHHLVFSTLLMSGLRKQEMENLEWTDLDFIAGTLSVRAKKNFRPKDWEERTIEIPQKLVGMLKAAKRTGRYVFGTKHGNRYTHVWDDCKEIAKKAGLVEEDFFPHKFRHVCDQGASVGRRFEDGSEAARAQESRVHHAVSRQGAERRREEASGRRLDIIGGLACAPKPMPNGRSKP